MSDSTLHYPETCWPLTASALPPVWNVEIKVEDWDVMFRSVVERLTHTACEAGEVALEFNGPASVVSLQAIVLECAGALCQLHAALMHDRIRID